MFVTLARSFCLSEADTTRNGDGSGSGSPVPPRLTWPGIFDQLLEFSETQTLFLFKCIFRVLECKTHLKISRLKMQNTFKESLSCQSYEQPPDKQESSKS